MTEKVIGYILLISGVVIIIASAISGYLVFTKQAAPAPLFNLPGISLDISKALSGSLPLGFLSSGKTAPPQQIISADTVNQPMNLFAHLMLVGFIATIGSKLATIGVQLIRPIVVETK